MEMIYRYACIPDECCQKVASPIPRTYFSPVRRTPTPASEGRLDSCRKGGTFTYDRHFIWELLLVKFYELNHVIYGSFIWV